MPGGKERVGVPARLGRIEKVVSAVGTGGTDQGVGMAVGTGGTERLGIPVETGVTEKVGLFMSCS